MLSVGLRCLEDRGRFDESRSVFCRRMIRTNASVQAIIGTELRQTLTCQDKLDTQINIADRLQLLRAFLDDLMSDDLMESHEMHPNEELK